MRRECVGLVLALVGCDPTAGLSDSADAALPQVKRYFDGPGSQVASGPWNRVVVDLDADTLYHVGARRLDDEQPTFHLFGADAREGCEVAPNSGTWLMGKPLPAPFRLLPFLEDMDEQGRGRLRFTTLDCRVQDLVIENAGRPYPRLYDHGYLVPTGDGYTFADPWSGTKREIAGKLDNVLVWSDVVLLQADGKLKSFSSQFDVGSEWGDEPVASVPNADDFLVEDKAGLHRVQLDRDSLKIGAEDVLPETCRLQRSQLAPNDDTSLWLTLSTGCDDPQPRVVHIDRVSYEILESIPLPAEVDTRYARLLAARSDDEDEPPLTIAYLTDVDDDGLGNLWIWAEGADAPVQVGEHAEVDSAYLLPRASDWAGIAQVNYQLLGGYLAHDWVHFHWDGSSELIGERIVRNPSSGEVLVNFDGVAGDLPLFLQDGYVVLAQGLAPYSGEASSYIGEPHRALVDHFDGDSGRALLGAEAKNSVPSGWQVVGDAVPPEQLRFAWFMPALLFIDNWDAKQQSGSLVAYNYELDARSTIAEGVSSFDLTSYPWDGVVYSVPRGKNQGLWFAKAK